MERCLIDKVILGLANKFLGYHYDLVPYGVYYSYIDLNYVEIISGRINCEENLTEEVIDDIIDNYENRIITKQLEHFIEAGEIFTHTETSLPLINGFETVMPGSEVKIKAFVVPEPNPKHCPLSSLNFEGYFIGGCSAERGEISFDSSHHLYGFGPECFCNECGILEYGGFNMYTEDKGGCFDLIWKAPCEGNKMYKIWLEVRSEPGEIDGLEWSEYPNFKKYQMEFFVPGVDMSNAYIEGDNNMHFYCEQKKVTLRLLGHEISEGFPLDEIKYEWLIKYEDHVVQQIHYGSSDEISIPVENLYGSDKYPIICKIWHNSCLLGEVSGELKLKEMGWDIKAKGTTVVRPGDNIDIYLIPLGDFQPHLSDYSFSWEVDGVPRGKDKGYEFNWQAPNNAEVGKTYTIKANIKSLLCGYEKSVELPIKIKNEINLFCPEYIYPYEEVQLISEFSIPSIIDESNSYYWNIDGEEIETTAYIVRGANYATSSYTWKAQEPCSHRETPYIIFFEIRSHNSFIGRSDAKEVKYKDIEFELIPQGTIVGPDDPIRVKLDNFQPENAQEFIQSVSWKVFNLEIIPQQDFEIIVGPFVDVVHGDKVAIKATIIDECDKEHEKSTEIEIGCTPLEYDIILEPDTGNFETFPGGVINLKLEKKSPEDAEIIVYWHADPATTPTSGENVSWTAPNDVNDVQYCIEAEVEYLCMGNISENTTSKKICIDIVPFQCDLVVDPLTVLPGGTTNLNVYYTPPEANPSVIFGQKSIDGLPEGIIQAFDNGKQAIWHAPEGVEEGEYIITAYVMDWNSDFVKEKSKTITIKDECKSKDIPYLFEGIEGLDVRIKNCTIGEEYSSWGEPTLVDDVLHFNDAGGSYCSNVWWPNTYVLDYDTSYTVSGPRRDVQIEFEITYPCCSGNDILLSKIVRTFDSPVHSTHPLLPYLQNKCADGQCMGEFCIGVDQ